MLSTDPPTLHILNAPTGPLGSAAQNPQDSYQLWLGGMEGLFRHSLNGQHTSRISRETRYAHSIVIHPADPQRLYLARRDGTSFLPLCGVYCSQDAGRTWTTQANGLNDERIFALTIDEWPPYALYAGSWAGRVYASTDDGNTWTRTSPTPVRASTTAVPSTITQLLVTPSNGALYAGTSYGGTFRSTDQGHSWEQVSTQSGWIAYDPLHDDLYVAGAHLQRSFDGGHSWSDLSAGLPYNPATGTYATYWIAINPEPLILYTRYHRSHDQGRTWEPLPTPANFIPRLLVAGDPPTLIGSLNGQTAWYRQDSQ